MPTETFVVKLEPINSDIPPFLAKATRMESGVPTHPIYYPPGIWGPTDPRPSHPISGIPGLPGYEPPLGIWGPLPGFPTHPIVIPPIENPPAPPEATLVWIWQPELSRWIWGYQPTSGMLPKSGECQPPAPPGWSFTWVYQPEIQRWISGYQKESGAGPRAQGEGTPTAEGPMLGRR